MKLDKNKNFEISVFLSAYAIRVQVDLTCWNLSRFQFKALYMRIQR